MPEPKCDSLESERRCKLRNETNTKCADQLWLAFASRSHHQGFHVVILGGCAIELVGVLVTRQPSEAQALHPVLEEPPHEAVQPHVDRHQALRRHRRLPLAQPRQAGDRDVFERRAVRPQRSNQRRQQQGRRRCEAKGLRWRVGEERLRPRARRE
eukprot:CAMPEP_0174853400 /NCGR_PEP_ID=MMETSP1114-20130205/28326_1 /TAXON_ID=312471 /ORGANISM="Neobodo designis, Strain CCAP 1951/1" /LENGTH=154 /DNA_ID=CAMNT_0016088043 /DNA_START=39 /DNA_END=503 /DNA_ORIENTATION=-